MLIGVKKRFVFVANSKTASTSIEQALGNHAEIMRGGTAQHKHIYMRDALSEYAFLFNQPGYAPDSFFRFGVMRDPIDWIQSWYRYRRGNKVANPLPEDLSFEDFWTRKDWNIQRANGAKHLQRDFFIDTDGKMLVDYIIPYHEIGFHFGAICDALGVKRSLPRKNVSKIRRTGTNLPDDLLAEMRTFYAEDYALLEGVADLNSTGSRKLDTLSAA
ncbi:hypothetical protein [uncultured Tateyamaria sp.]|uniref:hypothetical protein n=1 Tax=uncultured Tateyamaria sp. TaxID=455651 RepID=UPI002631F665|nr:hypothetical protein [uncultured Tateyamaria sp.]